jgi:AraC-like DNA-binding protein
MNSYGIRKYEYGAPMPRHRHAEPYMAVVVDGGYLEAGDAGRIEARPGDVLLHAPFEAHRDSFGPRGATVLNLPLEPDVRSAIGRLDDVDAIVRLAERDAIEASAQARSEMASEESLLCDWPDLLATALREDADLAIADWADRMGLAPASVSRGFARAYGISPKRFRFELRTRRAIGALDGWQGSLAAIAAEYGFADQAHFTRATVALTGRTPSRLKAAAR